MFVIFQLIITYIVFSAVCSISTSEQTFQDETSIVNIKMISRKKRSVDNSNSDEGYDLELMAFDKTHNLELRSTGSIFTNDFTFRDLDVDKNGEVIQPERTPSKREIREIEDNIYIDAGANAVLKVRDLNGQLHLEGLVDTIRLRRDPDDENQTVATNDEAQAVPGRSDYVDFHRPVATPRGLSTAPISVIVELVLVMDYELSKIFNFDNVKIMDYLSVMVNAVYNRYSTLSDPKIKFRISGIYSSTGAQPFIEGSKVNDKIDVDKLLQEFSQFAAKGTMALPPYDILSLVHNYKATDDATTGLAFYKGACLPARGGMSHAIGIVRDSGGTWYGMLGLAHELSHNLGAPHDGDKGAEACGWSDGYIMSYIGFGKINKFTFSQCSAKLMKGFLQSTGGTCIWKQQNPHPPPEIRGNIGDRISMSELCKSRFVISSNTHPENVAVKDGNEQCMDLACRFKTPKGRMAFKSFNELPGDNSQCGDGGKGVMQCKYSLINITNILVPSQSQKNNADDNFVILQRCQNGKCVGG